MDLMNCPWHTRRGFSRGEFVPAELPAHLDLPAAESIAARGLPIPAPAPKRPEVQEVSSCLAALAQEIAGQAYDYNQDFADASRAIFTASAVERIMQALSPRGRGVAQGERRLVENLKAALEQMEEDSGDCDPHLDTDEADRASQAVPRGLRRCAAMPYAEDSFNPNHFHALADLDLSFELALEQDDDELSAGLSLPRAGMFSAHVQVAADGRRVETFNVGSTVLKDALGRVVEVKSPYGDMLGFNYGMFGSIESVWRTDGRGNPHSHGSVDKHGVVIRDAEGRVRAAGESMTVDPRGCFFLHTVDSQFFSVDLVSGIHTERRKFQGPDGRARHITALFTRDGFRMATVFAAAGEGTEYGAECGNLSYRFYGRDGTLIEFACPDDLQELRPSRVMPPASRRICPGWRKQRQANTAWQAVQEYLMRVS